MDHQRNAPTDGNEEFNSDSSNETGNSGISEPHGMYIFKIKISGILKN